MIVSEPCAIATCEIRTVEVATIVPVRSLITIRASVSGTTSISPEVRDEGTSRPRYAGGQVHLDRGRVDRGADGRPLRVDRVRHPRGRIEVGILQQEPEHVVVHK